MKLLQEFFSRETDPSGIPYYRSRIDGRWKTETIQALAKYLHDQNARVAFTRDFHPKYNFIKGKDFTVKYDLGIFVPDSDWYDH